MIQTEGWHACRGQTPSGSYRASIGFTAVGKICFRCDVKITEDMILPQAINRQNQPSPQGRQPTKEV